MKWILLCLALLAWLTAPSLHKKRARRWLGTCFAHRGLHGDGVSENSLRAFEAACQAGCGVELDVRFSRDGQLIVFHDDTLSRLCGAPRRPEQLTAAELAAMRLPDGQRLPTLDEALACIAGRVPLLVEVKSCRRILRLTDAVCARLARYPGDYLIESFDPRCLLRMRFVAPHVMRGQLLPSSEESPRRMHRSTALAVAGLLTNALSRPDFVAYRIAARLAPAPFLQRLIYRTPMAAWTVRTPDELALARRRGDMIIFEGESVREAALKPSGTNEAREKGASTPPSQKTL